MPVNYNLGKIYKIVDNTTDNIYIGSTCEPILSRRLAQHISSYKRYLNGKQNYVSSYDIIAKSDYDIILIELCPCNTKDELLARERYYRDTLICVNKNRPIISDDEKKEYGTKYRQVHKEQHKEYDAKYYLKHQEHLKAQKEQYHKNHQEYYKAKDKQRLATKFKCQCGGKYCGTSKTHHIRTQKHQNYIRQQQLLANHNAMMNKLDKIIQVSEQFIKLSERFLAGLNI